MNMSPSVLQQHDAILHGTTAQTAVVGSPMMGICCLLHHRLHLVQHRHRYSNNQNINTMLRSMVRPMDLIRHEQMLSMLQSQTD